MTTPISPLRYFSRVLLAMAAVVVLALALAVSAAGPARASSGSLDGDSLGEQGEQLLYLAVRNGDRVDSVPVSGGQEETVIEELEGPQGLAEADGTLFISEQGDRVVSAPVGGGAPEVLTDDVRSPRGLLVVGDLLYIADSANDRVLSVPTDGGDVEVVVDEGLNSPRDLAVHGDTLFIADRHNDRVVTTPLDGDGDLDEFHAHDGSVGYLEVADGLLYFSEWDGDTVWSMPVNGGDSTAFATGLDEVRGLAVSGDTLLISEKGAGRVLAQPMDGGEPETLVQLDDVYDIAVESAPCSGSACLPVVGSLFGSLG